MCRAGRRLQRQCPRRRALRASRPARRPAAPEEPAANARRHDARHPRRPARRRAHPGRPVQRPRTRTRSSRHARRSSASTHQRHERERLDDHARRRPPAQARRPRDRARCEQLQQPPAASSGAVATSPASTGRMPDRERERRQIDLGDARHQAVARGVAEAQREIAADRGHRTRRSITSSRRRVLVVAPLVEVVRSSGIDRRISDFVTWRYAAIASSRSPAFSSIRPMTYQSEIPYPHAEVDA